MNVSRRSRALIRRRSALDPSARLEAVRDLPEDPASCAELLEAAGDPSLDVARAALTRLATLGGQREAAVLRRRLLAVDLGLVPAYAATLRALGDRKAVDVACHGLLDESPAVRIGATLALRELRDPVSGPALRAAVADPISGVRRFALDALTQLGADRESEVVCAAALDDVDSEVRAAAVRALAQVATDPEPRLAEVRRDPAPSVRRELARLSSRLGDGLVSSLVLDDDDADVRAEALWALVTEPRQSLLDTLRSAADDPDWHVRWAACRALGAVRSERARERLVMSLVDSHATVRAAAARALVETFGDGLVEVLSSELTTQDPRVRRALVYRLADLGGEAATTPILGLEKDESPGVREAVAHGLAHVDEPAARAALERLRHDGDRDVRAAAETALDRIERADGG